MAKRPPKPLLRISSAPRALGLTRRRIGELISFVAAEEGQRLGEIDVAIVGEGEISALNRRHLSHAGATDVLSFDLSESDRPGISAQIVVCADVAAEQAPLHGLTPRHELMLYVIHGLLHLMGYEDSTVRGAARMRARQDELLSAFLSRPRRR